VYLNGYQETSSQIVQAERGALPEEDEYVRPKTKPVGEGKMFPGEIFVLQDAACASSCEGTIAILEPHPQVTTVGENSGGYVHFADVCPVQLPNSKIRIQMATKFMKLSDQRVVEKIGYAPRVRVTAGQDAYEVALQLIRGAESR